MNIKLIKLTKEYYSQLSNMIDEWKHDIEVNHTNRSPYAIFEVDYHYFDAYLASLDPNNTPEGYVPATTLFALDVDRNIFVGAVNIRHYLNEALLLGGGHIGDGVRPSERRKGYATVMINLALKECLKLGIHRVLMVCDINNIGSRKSIINNGGVKENEVPDEGSITERYWIDLDK